ncbi:helix-hairpin-helix domain-containing protein [Nocardia goodfellowii]
MPDRFRGARLDSGRRGVLTLAVVGLFAIVVTAVVVLRERPVAQTVPPLSVLRTTALARPSANAGLPDNPPSNLAAPEPATPTELVVSVVGHVHRPGLVRLPAGSRVADALTAAGTPIPTADLTGLNLAQRLLDGDQVLVGANPSAATPGTPQLGSGTISTGSPAAPTKGTTPTTRLNLNTATESELDALPGVGPITARAIVTWRTTNGPFTDPTQLGEVDGIGPARLARLRDLVRI